MISVSVMVAADPKATATPPADIAEALRTVQPDMLSCAPPRAATAPPHALAVVLRKVPVGVWGSRPQACSSERERAAELGALERQRQRKDIQGFSSHAWRNAQLVRCTAAPLPAAMAPPSLSEDESAKVTRVAWI